MELKIKMNELLPAGQYYFGDPCFVSDFCENFYVQPKPILAFSTYTSNNGLGSSGIFQGEGIFSNNKFIVDSGVLGFVHVSTLEVSLEEAQSFGVIVNMEKVFEFYAENGKFYVNGELIVDTEQKSFLEKSNTYEKMSAST
jgi:hypothetical protein